MSEELKPCPFCGKGENRIDTNTHWTGMQNLVLSVEVKHWCTREDGQPSSILILKGKTREDAISKWNTRT